MAVRHDTDLITPGCVCEPGCQDGLKMKEDTGGFLAIDSKTPMILIIWYVVLMTGTQKVHVLE